MLFVIGEALLFFFLLFPFPGIEGLLFGFRNTFSGDSKYTGS
jgi:hypothetical protein